MSVTCRRCNREFVHRRAMAIHITSSHGRTEYQRSAPRTGASTPPPVNEGETPPASHRRGNFLRPSPSDELPLVPFPLPSSRNRAKPLNSSRITTKSLRGTGSLGEVGARILAFDPMPVQREMWALLEARRRPSWEARPLHEMTVVEVPRRAGKTEGLHCLAVGRCSTIEDFQVTYCAQSGVKSRERFYNLLRRMRRTSDTGDWRSREARGEERIEWDNGSIMRFLPPQASSFRGDAVDWLILDEAQEVDEEDAAELMGSVMPVFDTREAAQLTVSGTAGGSRSGLLWDALEKGRRGGPDAWGILEYAAPAGSDPDSPATWLRTHPGPAGVSPERALEVLVKRHREMSPDMFAREYLGMWPEDVLQTAFSAETWERAGVEHADRPSGVAIGFDVTPDRSAAAIACAWREPDGTARIELLDARSGTVWLVPRLLEWSAKLRAPIGYDSVTGSGVLDFADDIARHRRGVKLVGLSTGQYVSACAALASGIVDGKVRHPRQPDLDTAITVAKRRKVGDAGWGWGRSASDGNIAPLVAATVALKVYDETPQVSPLRVITASG